MEKKRTIWQAVICVGLVCLIWGGYFITRGKIDRQIQLYEDDFSWVHQVDTVEQEGKDIVLNGFAFKLDEDSKKGSFEIVLKDMETGNLFFPKMKYGKRVDVNEYFLCEYDYLNSGYEAIIRAKELKMDNRDYEVLLKMKNEKKTYQTGTYISNGELMYVNPKEYVPLEVEHEELRGVIEYGVERMCLPKLGVHVFQHEGYLYYVMEEKYKLQEEYYNRIVLGLRTTQIDNLPDIQKENGAYGDEINAYFDDVNTWDGYYVCKVKIPTEYSITKINCGNYYNNHWVWMEYMRPFYEFQ